MHVSLDALASHSSWLLFRICCPWWLFTSIVSMSMQQGDMSNVVLILHSMKKSMRILSVLWKVHGVLIVQLHKSPAIGELLPSLESGDWWRENETSPLVWVSAVCYLSALLGTGRTSVPLIPKHSLLEQVEWSKRTWDGPVKPGLPRKTRHPFNGRLSRTAWVRWHQKD